MNSSSYFIACLCSLLDVHTVTSLMEERENEDRNEETENEVNEQGIGKRVIGENDGTEFLILFSSLFFFFRRTICLCERSLLFLLTR